MPWYNEPRTTVGPFLAWLERNEGRKDKRKAVAIFQGAVYLAGVTLESGTGSYNVLSGGPLANNPANEKLALTMEMAIQAGSGEAPAMSEGKLGRTIALGRYIVQNAVPQTSTAPRKFRQNDRSADNFVRAAQQAQDAGNDLRQIQNEMAAYARFIKDHIQRWFDVWNVMRSETADPAAVKTLESLRSHQKMKIAGGSFGRGKHTAGQFVLHTRAIDGKPILLVSSGVSKSVKDKYMNTTLGNSSVVGRTLLGTFTQVPKTKSFAFAFTGGKSVGDYAWFRNLSSAGRSTIVLDALKATGILGEGEGLLDNQLAITLA